MGSYEDIIETKWTGVRRHPRQDRILRAAQFSPFAALTGFEGELEEAARLVDQRVELTESAKEELDAILTERMQEEPDREIIVEYFLPDMHKAGGSYQTLRGQWKKFDSYERRLVMRGGEEIPLEQIRHIDFAQLEE